MPTYQFEGYKVRLRDLTDQEYDYAVEEAELGGRVLTHCPTCSGRGKYRYHGEGHECDCVLQMALYRHYMVANIPEQYMRLNWKADFAGPEEAKETVDLFTENWEIMRANGTGLDFRARAMGVGKTWGATHVGKELVKQAQRVFFIRFDRMTSAFTAGTGNWIESRMYSTPLMVLDEIVPPTTDRQHDFYAGRLETIIRHRTDYNLPTITTSNLSDDELEKWYPRVYSLLSAKQLPVDLRGVDARLTTVQAENQELSINKEIRPIT